MSPFKLKDAKEKELGGIEKFVKEKDKEIAKDTKDHKDKEKDKDKDKDGKDQADKHKLEKELKDRHKEIVKEVKVEIKEHTEVLQPFATSAPAPDPEAAAAAGITAQKAVEHKVIEKVQVDKHLEKLPKLEKHEKFEFEKYFDKVLGDGKGLVEGGSPVQTGDPSQFEQRMAAVESAVAQLMHFIPANLRPDLTQGALKQEPDAEAKPEAAKETPKEADKHKK